MTRRSILAAIAAFFTPKPTTTLVPVDPDLSDWTCVIETGPVIETELAKMARLRYESANVAHTQYEDERERDREFLEGDDWRKSGKVTITEYVPRDQVLFVDEERYCPWRKVKINGGGKS